MIQDICGAQWGPGVNNTHCLLAPRSRVRAGPGYSLHRLFTQSRTIFALLYRGEAVWSDVRVGGPDAGGDSF